GSPRQARHGWPAERIEYWALERLIPYASNARLHRESDIDKLADSLRRWGWTNPALVDEHGVLIAGHGRIRAAAKLGLTSIPVMIARGWSEEEKRAYRLAEPLAQVDWVGCSLPRCSAWSFSASRR